MGDPVQEPSHYLEPRPRYMLSKLEEMKPFYNRVVAYDDDDDVPSMVKYRVLHPSQEISKDATLCNVLKGNCPISNQIFLFHVGSGRTTHNAATDLTCTFIDCMFSALKSSIE